MTSIIHLGKFERVLVTDAWPREDANFTPWLAEEESITLLGEALGMELEVEAVERPVGPFRADIVALSDEPDHRVLIENQFGETDHRHLGQILTYLPGLEYAKTVVWIAEKIQDNHRAAIDWLNVNTNKEFQFFAIEIELLKIGESPPAPRFNVVASPNDWTKKVGPPGSRGDLAERHKIRLAYWKSFADYLKKAGSHFRIKSESIQPWFWFAIGRAGFGIIAHITPQKRRIAVWLDMPQDSDKSAFHALDTEKEAIEREFGESLTWDELPTRKLSRVAIYRYDVNPADPAQYDNLHAWMLDKMEKFRTVFSARVKGLILAGSALPAEEEPEDP